MHTDGDFFDLSELSAAADRSVELDALRARMGVILDAIADGVLSVDLAGRIDVANPTACDLLGRREPELRGAWADGAMGRHPDERHPAMADLIAADGRHEAEETLVRADGSTFPAEVTVRPLQVAGVTVGAVIVFRDITERRAATEHLAWMAGHDPLTGLVNRAALEGLLDGLLSGGRRGDGTAALLFCDLDGFKAVNDTYGHAAGDVLLCEIARRLPACVRDSDVVARLGGDEFVIALSGVDHPADTHAAAARVEQAVRRPVDHDGRRLSVGVSVGVAVARPGQSAAELLRAADAAMYERKRQRKTGR